MNINLLFLCASAIFGATGCFAYKTTTTLYHPVAVYGLTWGLLVGLFALRLIRYDDPPFYGFILILLGFGGFVLGVICFRGSRRDRAKTVSVRAALQLNKDAFKSVWTALIVMCAIAAVATAVKATDYVRLFGVFWGEHTTVTNARAQLWSGDVDYYHPLTGYFSSVSLGACCLGGILIAAKRARHLLVWLPLLLCMCNDYLYFGRTWTMLGALLYLFAYAQARGRQRFMRPWRVILIGVLLWAGLVAVFVPRVQEDAHLTTVIAPYWTPSGDLFSSPTVAAVAYSYLYATSSIPAFSQKVANYTEQHTLGIEAIGPVVKLLRYAYPDLPKPVFAPDSVWVPLQTNYYTYLMTFYNDWGLIGVFLGPFVMGAVCGASYTSMKRNGSVMSCVVLSYVNAAVAFSVFSYAFTLGAFTIGLGAVLCTLKMVRMFRSQVRRAPALSAVPRLGTVRHRPSPTSV